VKQLKKAIILAVALSLLLAGAAVATVVSSNHDIRFKNNNVGTKQVCVFCHHPHRGASPVTSTLLWNMNDFNVTSWTTYASAGMDATDFGDTLGTSGPAAFSYLCLACHDGSVGGDADLISDPLDGTGGDGFSITGQANLGTTLADDHPVDFDYTAAQAGDVTGALKAPDTTNDWVLATDATYPLFDNTMQCATCHNVHNGTDSETDNAIQFMRGSTDVISDSKICRDCHLNK
jgi:hypothetical protein